ncbi:MAG: isoprenylcysteine carboxylmethyltransferase family protein [Betaproteobacteria bacterium]|nr:isoprenylcysteine carboxylmethyltransferase family protein [Betaproteobacteria bacterium]
MAFLLSLGGTRYYYFVSAGVRPADRSYPAVDRALQVPAYFASAVWTVYVAWSVLAPPRLVEWDRWPLSHGVSDPLVWAAIPLFAVGLWLFWYSHRTIGSYWSIQIEIKKEHRLVMCGPYRYIRHPLYTALFFGYLGTLLALQSWTLTAGFPAFVASYLLFAKEEENVMERGFGETYRAYRRQTGMFLPEWAKIRADILHLLVVRRARDDK